MSSIFKKELHERFPEYTIYTLDTTHSNVLGLSKNGSPNLVAKTIWHDISDPHGEMGIKAQDKAYASEVKILKMLPDWWLLHLVDNFKTKENRIIVTNEISNIPWKKYKKGTHDTVLAKQILRQINWLHSHKIAHNDLELKNILLALDTAVIIDFEKSTMNASKKQMENDYRMLFNTLNENINTKSIGLLIKPTTKTRKNRK